MTPVKKPEPPLEGAVGGEEEQPPTEEGEGLEEPLVEDDDEVKVYPKGGAPKFPQASEPMMDSVFHGSDSRKTSKGRKVRLDNYVYNVAMLV